jgi:hypothetical protein
MIAGGATETATMKIFITLPLPANYSFELKSEQHINYYEGTLHSIYLKPELVSNYPDQGPVLKTSNNASPQKTNGMKPHRR